jgi:hypothetical protein
MSPPLMCVCALCNLETRLLSALSSTETQAINRLLSASASLSRCSSATDLLAHMKSLRPDTGSDEFLRDLLVARTLNPSFVESVFVLAFLPALHGTVRRAGKQQPGISPEDIAQQALSILLQYLRSDELHVRQSHFAFAISRAVKRRLFEWAQREGRSNGTAQQGDRAALHKIAGADSFERHLLLRHFLHRCVTKRLISDSELNLLIQLKLDGGSLEAENGSNGNSTNAVRQKLKRLLRKLRRLAQQR